MVEKLNNKIKNPIWGIIGSLIALSGFIIAAFGYIGVSGDGYSILNHFVSELGISTLTSTSWAFNIGLIIGGIFMLLFIIGICKLLNTKIGLVIGVISGINATLVGVFPAEPNLLIAHAIVALTFFFGGMLTIFILTIAILRQGTQIRISKKTGILGFIVTGIFIVFLTTSFSGDSNFSSFEDILLNRPFILLPAFFEWLAVLAIIGWILTMGIYMHIEKVEI